MEKMNVPKLNLENITISEKSKSMLEASQKAMGFVPNMYKYMAANTANLDAYSYAYDSFRRHSGFSPVEQEVILLSVSYVNNCEYCMAAHSFVGDKMSKVPIEITDAIRAGKTLPDDRLNALSQFTKQMVEKRAWVSRENVEAFFSQGYNPSHVLGVVSGIAVKTLSNYSNHLTQPDLDQIFESRKWNKSEL